MNWLRRRQPIVFLTNINVDAAAGHADHVVEDARACRHYMKPAAKILLAGPIQIVANRD
ncbi:hypothetical protein [Bradyrhizobium commune]|uniref:Uncharacterized protein n=1 Tax=Bradyrhizobium commune TaxID=83627 RepID=A0A7S9GZE0_9BRAD|nr:hypothetical protein [Bradyrhizobium commune]QPF90796.1 hypothetical protein IC761_30680 [Bradyrhizobium commune]